MSIDTLSCIPVPDKVGELEGEDAYERLVDLLEGRTERVQLRL